MAKRMSNYALTLGMVIIALVFVLSLILMTQTKSNTIVENDTFQIKNLLKKSYNFNDYDKYIENNSWGIGHINEIYVSSSVNINERQKNMNRSISDIALIIPTYWNPQVKFKYLDRILSNVVYYSTVLPSEIIISMSSFPCIDNNNYNNKYYQLSLQLINKYLTYLNNLINVKLYLHCDTKHAGPNRNFAVSKINDSITNYISSFDSDDWMEFHRFEILNSIYKKILSKTIINNTIILHCFQYLDCKYNFSKNYYDHENIEYYLKNFEKIYQRCKQSNPLKMIDKYYNYNQQNSNSNFNFKHLNIYNSFEIVNKTIDLPYFNVYDIPIYNLSYFLQTRNNYYCDSNGIAFGQNKFECLFKLICCEDIGRGKFLYSVGWSTMHKNIWKSFQQSAREKHNGTGEDAAHLTNILLKNYDYISTRNELQQYHFVYVPITLGFYCKWPPGGRFGW